MNVIGLDIGTTTVCAVVTDSQTGEVLRSVTCGNETFLKSDRPFEKIQSPEKITDMCMQLVSSLTREFAPVESIGVTGQMHGILYINREGNAVSPLYIWQDESGNEPYMGSSYARVLSEMTGYRQASGFGMTTLFYHTKNNLVPRDAVGFCTIHDYVVMKLTNRTSPLTHTSDAASFGLFDLESLSFDTNAANDAEIDSSLFPSVTRELEAAGVYDGKIPVCVAVGDNQASFIGSVSDMENSVLINLGTGGQISFLTDSVHHSSLEVRPCFGTKYICVGASLCGGRAFALTEKFLRETVKLVTGTTVDSAYPAIDAFLSGQPCFENPLVVSTQFAGTRDDPSIRGSICNIGLDNFTPQQVITGVLGGMVSELCEMYSGESHGEHTALVGSGNALRKNPALQRMLSLSFGNEMKIPSHSEEASFGASLCAMTAAGLKKDIYAAQQLINYK